MNVKIRVAHLADFTTIAEIGRTTFYETWREVNTEEDMQSYIASAFDLERIEKDVKDSTVNTFLLAFSDNEIVGYVKMRTDRTYEEFKDSKSIEIERIYVKKEFQNRKAGKALMDRCIEIAIERKYDWIWLGVNVDNQKAIDFYKAYGFTIFGEKSFQLGTAVDTDYLMKKKL